MKYKSFNKNNNCLVTVGGDEIPFDRKNVEHVIWVKMNMLVEAANALLHIAIRIENGQTISDCCRDIEDIEGRETYWINDANLVDNANGTNVEINPLDHPIGQLCLQVDKDGNWY